MGRQATESELPGRRRQARAGQQVAPGGPDPPAFCRWLHSGKIYVALTAWGSSGSQTWQLSSQSSSYLFGHPE